MSVRVQADKGQAFVEYTQPDDCELAIASMNRKPFVGRTTHVKWARAPKRGEVAVEKRGEKSSASSTQPRLIKPMAPPGMSKAPLSKGLTLVKPPAHVAVIAAARQQKTGGASSGVNVPRPSSNVQRPGGGAIRGVGVGAARRAGGLSKPYYASADPSWLGS